jgi:transposase
MTTPQKEPLRAVTGAEQTVLERVAKASSERVDRGRRATALLVVARGGTFRQAAQQAGLRSSSAITALVKRFNHRGLGALTIAPGRGRKPTYDPVARGRIVATAQRAPERKTDGTATWSLGTLRREAFPRLGGTTIRRVLQDAGSSYQKTRTWCPTGTAERKRKSGIVRVVDPHTEEKRD